LGKALVTSHHRNFEKEFLQSQDGPQLLGEQGSKAEKEIPALQARSLRAPQERRSACSPPLTRATPPNGTHLFPGTRLSSKRWARSFSPRPTRSPVASLLLYNTSAAARRSVYSSHLDGNPARRAPLALNKQVFKLSSTETVVAAAENQRFQR